jgi:hypothetical protein
MPTSGEVRCGKVIFPMPSQGSAGSARLPRPAAGTETGLQAQILGGALDPARGAVGSMALDTAAQGSLFGLGLWALDVCEPLRMPRYRTGIEPRQARRGPALRASWTRPSPRRGLPERPARHGARHHEGPSRGAGPVRSGRLDSGLARRGRCGDNVCGSRARGWSRATASRC